MIPARLEMTVVSSVTVYTDRVTIQLENVQVDVNKTGLDGRAVVCNQYQAELKQYTYIEKQNYN